MLLSQSQAQLPTTLHLQSSSTLGTGKSSTNRERLEKLEDKETRRAIDGRAGKRKRNDDKYDIMNAVHENEDIEFDQESIIQVLPTSSPNYAKDVLVVDSVDAPQLALSKPSAVGSALYRNPDGSVVAPRISKKIKIGKKASLFSYFIIL